MEQEVGTLASTIIWSGDKIKAGEELEKATELSPAWH